MMKRAMPVLVSLLWLATTVAAQQTWNGWSDINKAFAFGASYIANGFDINGPQPNAAAGNPFGNPPGIGKTSDNGPNVVEFLTTKYNESLISTYDFAVAGAVINSSVYKDNHNNDFVAQVNNKFLPHYSKQETAGWTSANTLFVIFFAINDVYRSYSRTDNPADAIFATYTRLIEQLYATGARNFLILNVPPIDRSPGIIAKGPSAVASIGAYIPIFNARFAALANALNNSHPDAKVFVFDTYTLFKRVLDNPSKFPQTKIIRNTDGFCPAYHNAPTMDFNDPRCGLAVNQYFWLNELHPTYPVHEVAAVEIAKFLRESA
ncbi:MAG: hypothetical protein Q9225_003998 [Loekoesia sp. 1 TL-2023]